MTCLLEEDGFYIGFFDLVGGFFFCQIKKMQVDYENGTKETRDDLPIKLR